MNRIAKSKMDAPQPTFRFTKAALRELDRRAVEQYHIPILVLMENAGRAVAETAKNMLKPGAGVIILCGTGNNAGDGLVAARHLHNAGHAVTVLLLAPPHVYKDAAATQLAIIEAMHLPLETTSPGHPEFRDWHVESPPDDILIDALFGTGLSRPVEGLPADLIDAANHSARKILAVDIPSGLDADTGEILGTAIKAARTVSFCGTKKGFPAASAHTGPITLADIGAPRELLQELADK
jgi:NAD(P)H-hydrate epimerase